MCIMCECDQHEQEKDNALSNSTETTTKIEKYF